jgi:NADH:ubiquinone oxidoreductase subunit 2 (subunit N)
VVCLSFYFYRACIEYKGFIFDFYSCSLKLGVSFLLIISASCLFFYYKNYGKTYIFELPLIFLFLLFFLFFLISSFDFLAIFFCTEGVTFCLASVIVYSYSYEDSSYAALKYLILGSVAAGFFAFGSALLFSMAGTTNFYKIQKYVYFNLLKLLSIKKEGAFNLIIENSICGFKISLLSFSIAVLLIIFGLFFKLSLAPMHQ